jgi:hypothetical protein
MKTKKILRKNSQNRLTKGFISAKINFTCEKGFICRARFRFRAGQGPLWRAGRQSASPAQAGQEANNKEVPLNARESDHEMQRVQAEKLQHHEEQEEHPGQDGNEQVLPLLQEAHAP